MTRLAGADRDQWAAAADHVDEVHESDARADWERRIYRKTTDTTGADRRMELPAPTGMRAVGAVGHIRLSWNRVPGAVGYLIERTDGQNGPSVRSIKYPTAPGTRFQLSRMCPTAPTARIPVGAGNSIRRSAPVVSVVFR